MPEKSVAEQVQQPEATEDRRADIPLMVPGLGEPLACLAGSRLVKRPGLSARRGRFRVAFGSD